MKKYVIAALGALTTSTAAAAQVIRTPDGDVLAPGSTKQSSIMGAALITLILFFVLLKSAEKLLEPAEVEQQRSSLAVGYTAPGKCMSGLMYNSATEDVVTNTDWSRVEGSAAYSSGTKTLISAMRVFSEMWRLGTVACPELAPFYNAYLVAKNLQQPGTQQNSVSKVLMDRVQLKTDGNLRREPSSKAEVVRVAPNGDTYQQFGIANGWVQVGKETPEGWIAESAIIHLGH